MTPEERFAQIEHFTAAIAEQRRKDREEYKTLWRDQQRQIETINRQIESIHREVQQLAVETRLRIEEVGDQIEATDRRLRELGEATDRRIAALTSAIGEHRRAGHPPQQQP